MAYSSPAKCLALLTAAALLSACSYSSTYVPPNDGRARVVWAASDVAVSLPTGTPAVCGSEIDALRGGDGTLVARYRRGPVVGFWAPVVIAGPHPMGPIGHVAASPHVGGIGGFRPVPHAPSHSGGGGGGNLNGLGQGAVVVAVIALLALPIVAVSLAASRPESAGLTSNAMDQVNAYNDLARWGDPACVSQEVGP